jgi:hypothetical protein
MTLEKLGIPTVLICTDAFYPLAVAEAEAKGMPNLSIVNVPHPIGSISREQAVEYGKVIADEVLKALSMEENQAVAAKSSEEMDYIEITRTNTNILTSQDELSLFDTVNDYFYDNRMTDGLPVVPPTRERVAEMLRHTTLDPKHSLGEFPPQWSNATIDRIAVNAVMAGCEPRYFPVVIAALKALLDPSFNLYAIQATTNPVTPLVVVNGPIAQDLKMNSKGNALGQGNKANMTIGRAVRLSMLNIGNALPGDLDRATQGQPGKISFCFAENEEQNPWEPYHVESNFQRNENTVTVFGAAGTQNILDLSSTNAQSLLIMIAGSMTALGTNNITIGGEVLVVLSPEHAQLISDAGFSKMDAKKFLYDYARVPLAAFPDETRKQVILKRRPKWFTNLPGHYPVPVVDYMEDIKLLVAGGDGGHSTFIPSFGPSNRSVIIRIE